MMRRLIAPFVIVLVTAATLPASAQVYPERVRTSMRTQDRQRQDRAQRDQGREEQTERITKTVRIGASGELDVANIAGDIIVTRGSGPDATIEIVKTARAQSVDDAKAMLGLVQVDVIERGGRAEVRTRYPSGDEMRTQNRRNVNVSVTYTITAPAGARVTARSISGSVSARDIRGDVSLESVSGNVTIANGGRVTGAKTISGNVEISGTELDGALEASSVSGTVALRKVKARSLTLSTVSGNLTAEDVDCQRIGMQAVSGDVQLSGTLAAGGRYDITSHSGEVRIAISGDTGFELDANSFSGSIRSDLPLSGQTGSTDRAGRRQHAVHGVYGNGSAVLDVTTFSGSIVISKR